jgi:hypothetical protein
LGNDLAGDPKDQSTQQLLAALRGRFLPNMVVLLRAEGEEGRAIEELIPFLKDKTQIEGKATAYVARTSPARCRYRCGGDDGFGRSRWMRAQAV